MTSDQTIKTNQATARIVGGLFLLATVTYMAGSGLLDSILNAPDYLRQVDLNRTQVVSGVLLQFIDAAAVAAIGILLFPILRKHSEAIALSYAATRIIECVLLLVAGISSLALIALSQAGGLEAAQAVGTAVVAQSRLAFQIAMIGLGLGSLPFCYLLYRTRLIPRALAALGLVGYVALFSGGVLELFGLDLAMLHYLPGGVFELLLPLWLLVKGFNATPQAARIERASESVAVGR